MKLIWKLSLPQMGIVVCLGLIGFAVIGTSYVNLRERYVKEAVETRFIFITKEIENKARDAVRQTALFVRLPVVVQAYELALSGNIDDAYCPLAQAARELLRKELAPMLDSYHERFGERLQLHFHLPNARSLVRLWRDKQTRIRGEAIDVSDDLVLYRPTVVEVNKGGKMVMGIELGSGGFAIRGVIPVLAPDGRQLGSAEVLQEFKPILDAAREEGSIEFVLYIDKERIYIDSDLSNPAAIATEMQDPDKHPLKGDFVRVTATGAGLDDRLITPELLSRGRNGRVFQDHGSKTFVTHPIHDYQGSKLGVLVCAMNTEEVAKVAFKATLTLSLILLGMTLVPSLSLLQGLRVLAIRPLNNIQEKIKDITMDRADLGEQLPSHQLDEIGELARWFNALTAKLGIQLQTIERLSLMDQLTKIPNRRSFDTRLRMEWARAVRDRKPISLLIIDVDKFKNYNDTYGHLQGDAALRAIGKILTKTLGRPGDFFARWGGEEFAVLMPNTDINGGIHIGEQIRAAVENTAVPCADGSITKITVSIGVNAHAPTPDSSVDAFISGADKALYAAKNAGRNKVFRLIFILPP